MTTHVNRDLAVSRYGLVAAKQPSAVHAALDILDEGEKTDDAAATAALATGFVEL